MDDGWRWAMDGGGSGGRLVLVARGARYEATCGPANVATDFDGAIAAINAGLSRLARQAAAQIEALRAAPCCLALAGVLDATDADRVIKALRLTQARVIEDQVAAVHGALGGADGSVAGLGTGSFFARRAAGHTRYRGGWGAVLGDEASGYWIGREALRASLGALEGTGPNTTLTAALVARFGGTRRGVIAFANAASRDAIAALAQDVAAAAPEDAAAQTILARGAAHIADQVHAMNHRPGSPFCLIGGLAPVYAPRIPAPLAADLKPKRGSALDGALALIPA